MLPARQRRQTSREIVLADAPARRPACGRSPSTAKPLLADIDGRAAAGEWVHDYVEGLGVPVQEAVHPPDLAVAKVH